MKNYTELSQLETYEERLEYLKEDGHIGEDTFGFDRYLNQIFYHTKEWRDLRNSVIIRDCGCDMGVPGEDIHGKVIIHHMNPITKDDVLLHSDILINPEYLVCVSDRTHRAIHYGCQNDSPRKFEERTPNDTCPWKK